MRPVPFVRGSSLTLGLKETRSAGRTMLPQSSSRGGCASLESFPLNLDESTAPKRMCPDVPSARGRRTKGGFQSVTQGKSRFYLLIAQLTTVISPDTISRRGDELFLSHCLWYTPRRLARYSPAESQGARLGDESPGGIIKYCQVRRGQLYIPYLKHVMEGMVFAVDPICIAR